MRVDAFKLPTDGPADVRGLQALLDDGAVRADQLVCVLGKTEGNGGRNDFTRDLAMRALEDLLAPRLGLPPPRVQDRVVFSLSGGTEGVVSPHVIAFARSGTWSEEPGPKRMVVGTAHTRPFAPAEIGRMPQIVETARAVAELARELRLDPADVHLVQMKGAIPHADHEAAQAARRAGAPLRNDMVHSRAASALGVALALGEVARGDLSDAVVCDDWSLWSGVASCSAKPGLQRTEILMFGNSAHAGGDLVVGHTVLQDILDVAAVRDLLARLGLPVAGGQLSPEQRAHVVGVFAKSEADPRGSIRGRRHTMLTDDDIDDTRHSRAALAAVLASVVGDPCVYVSTRAEHHGPLGGGPLAIIARVP
ncbi:ring-opening amidohydrolase [Nannocystis radixulma]|uniref:Cyclic amide hydrolase n=1 Tax=Nannocystis radixulma TaxID=2995305 RepID=A0ABT5BIB0_9BACT|nr:ring-opening amidohydrolase [Nannocystis radixulma]MDC0673244.1 ring-opening amidohydrolase [Nannocystis radixulma]